MSFFDNVLSSIDLLGIPVFINFSSKEKIKSRLGGVCSLLFVVFLAWTIYNSAKEMTSTVNPKTVSSETFNPNPRELYISTDEFPLAFSIQAPDNMGFRSYRNERIYTLKVYHEVFEKTVYPNGTLEQKIVPYEIPTEKCRDEHFGPLLSMFATFSFENLYCISREYPLRIGGAFIADWYETVTIKVFQCDNVTTNDSCETREVMNQYLEGAWFNVIYANMVVNPANYSYPEEKFQDFYSTTMSPTSSKQNMIYMSHLEVNTDVGAVSESLEKKSYAKIGQITETAQFRSLNDSSVPLIKTIFAVSRLESAYLRSYKKLQTVLAEVAGLANTCLLVFLVLTSHYFKLKFRETLMNQFFDLDIDPKDENPKRTKNKNIAKGKRASKDQQNNNFYPGSPANLSPIYHGQNSDSGKKLNSLATLLERSDTLRSSAKKSSVKDDPAPIGSLETRDHQKLKKYTIAKADSENKLKLPSIWEEDKDNPVQENQSPDDKVDSPDDVKLELKEIETLQNYECDNSPVYTLMTEGPLTKADLKKEMKTEQDQENPDQIEMQSLKDINVIKSQNNYPESGEQHKSDDDERVLKPPKEKQILRLSFWEYLCSFVYKPKFIRDKLETLDEGVKRINERLDVIHFLAKMREVDKLKVLLLDSDQMLLFNNLPKPVIGPKSSKERMLKSSTFSQEMLKKPISTVEEATETQVRQAYKQVKNKEHKTVIDEKILEIFDDSSD